MLWLDPILPPPSSHHPIIHHFPGDNTSTTKHNIAIIEDSRLTWGDSALWPCKLHCNTSCSKRGNLGGHRRGMGTDLYLGLEWRAGIATAHKKCIRRGKAHLLQSLLWPDNHRITCWIKSHDIQGLSGSNMQPTTLSNRIERQALMLA